MHSFKVEITRFLIDVQNLYYALANLLVLVSLQPDHSFAWTGSSAGHSENKQLSQIGWVVNGEHLGFRCYSIAGAGEDAPLQSAINTRNIFDPRFGLKLSGKLGRKNIISALYALDEYRPPAMDTIQPDNTHTGLVRYARNISQDSYIGALGTIKQNGKNYNYVAGLDGRWRLNARQHLEMHTLSSFSNTTASSSPTHGHALSGLYFFRSRHWSANTGLQVVSTDFSTQMGYLSRAVLTLSIFNTSGKCIPVPTEIIRWSCKMGRN